VSLDVRDEHFVIVPGSGVIPKITIADLSLSPATFDVVVTNFRGDVEHAQSITLAPDASGRATIELPSTYPTLGIKYVDLTPTGPSKDALAASGPIEFQSFAYLTPPGPAKSPQPFLLGLQGEDSDKCIRAASRAGAVMFRTGIDLRDVKPTEHSAWNFSKPDRQIDLIRASGMEPQALIAYGIPWALLDKYKQYDTDAAGNRIQKTGWPHGFIYPVRDDVWEEYCRQIARRYKGKVRYYEIWNEPDIGVFWLGTDEEYARLLRVAYRAIKAEDPDAIVGTAGFAYSTEPAIGNFGGHVTLQEHVLREAQDSFDLHIAHLHGDYHSFQWRIDDFLLKSRQKYNVKQPLLFNETAYSRFDRGGELDQAEQLYKKVLFAWSRGAVGLTWFKVHMAPTESPFEYGYSMFRGPLAIAQPKAVWAAYCVLASQVHDKQFVRDMTLSPGAVGFVIADKTETLAYVWHDDVAQPQTPVVLNVGAGSTAELLDVMGNSTLLDVVDGAIVLLPDATIRTLRVRGPAHTIAGESPVIRLAGALQRNDQNPTTASLTLANPTSATRQVALSLQLPDAGLAPIAFTTDVAAGASAVANFQLPALSPSAALYSKPAALSYAIVGTPWKGQLLLPIDATRTLGHQPATDRDADFVVADRAYVYDFFQGNPDKANLLWTGPADLSYRAWVWSDAGTLHFQIDVADNVHSQPHVAQDIWRGDAVQLALAFDDQPGYWELGVARHDDGRLLQMCWTRPEGVTTTPSVVADVQPIAGGMRYQIAVPLRESSALPSTAAGFRFNIALSDADTADGRKTTMELTPGIVLRKDPARFVRVRLP
jgi:hypothetical protein